MSPTDDGPPPCPEGALTLRARIHALALEVLGADMAGPLLVMFQAGTDEVYLQKTYYSYPAVEGLTEAAIGGSSPGGQSRAVPPCSCPGLAARLLAEATGEPTPRKVVCSRAGVAYGGRAGEAFAWLVRAGKLVSTPDGVALPGGRPPGQRPG